MKGMKMSMHDSTVRALLRSVTRLALLGGICLLVGLVAGPVAHADGWVLDRYEVSAHTESFGANVDGSIQPPLANYRQLAGPTPTLPPTLPGTVNEVECSVGGGVMVKQGATHAGTVRFQMTVTPVYVWQGNSTPSAEFFTRELGHLDVHRAHSDPAQVYTQAHPYSGELITIAASTTNGFEAVPVTFHNQGEHGSIYWAGDEETWNALHSVHAKWYTSRWQVPPGRRTFPGTARQFQCELQIGAVSAGTQYVYLHTTIRAKYRSEVCGFSLGVGTDVIEDYSQFPRDRTLVAWAQRSYKGLYLAPQQPLQFYWGGPTSYSANFSDNLRAILGNLTYSWSLEGTRPDLVAPELIYPLPVPAPVLAQSTLDDSTPSKLLPHEVNAERHRPPSTTRWQWPQTTQTRLTIDSDNHQQSRLTARAFITWQEKPLTHYETETVLQVYDAESGVVSPLRPELVDFEAGYSAEEMDIDQQIEGIREAYAQTVTTGAEYIRLALEAEMLVGTWYVPDELEVTLLVGGAVAQRAMKVKKIVQGILDVKHKVGEASLAVLKRTRKWKDKPCAVVSRTRVFRVQRGGYLPPGHVRRQEVMGEVNFEVPGHEDNGPIHKIKGVGCFVAGTPVVMGDGSLRAIEKLSVGDLVLARSESSGETAARRVGQVYSRPSPATLVLHLAGGGRVETTPEHPFYVAGKGFTPAGEVGVGTSIVTRAGPALAVTRVEPRQSQQDAIHGHPKRAIQPINYATTTVTQSRPRSVDGEDVDPRTWRVIDMVMNTTEGSKVQISMLRPLWWVAEVGAEEGKIIGLSISEMGLSGPTKVLSIKPIRPGPPRGSGVVTGTFKHIAANVLDMQLDGEAKAIGVTYSHMIRSVDRKGWVAAVELKKGEGVESRTGPIKVVSLKKRSGKEPVYNLEVHKHHTYFVSKSGVWVHNNCLIIGEKVGDTVNELPLKPVQGWVSKARVDAYVSRLKADPASVWNDLTPSEKIIVDQYGNLLNGHHRVVAAQIAGVPIPEVAIERVTVANPMTGREWTDVITIE